MLKYKINTGKILKWILKLEKDGYFETSEYIVFTDVAFIKVNSTLTQEGTVLEINPLLKKVEMWDEKSYESYKKKWNYLQGYQPNSSLVRTNINKKAKYPCNYLSDRGFTFDDFKEWFEEGGDE